MEKLTKEERTRWTSKKIFHPTIPPWAYATSATKPDNNTTQPSVAERHNPHRGQREVLLHNIHSGCILPSDCRLQCVAKAFHGGHGHTRVEDGGQISQEGIPGRIDLPLRRRWTVLFQEIPRTDRGTPPQEQHVPVFVGEREGRESERRNQEQLSGALAHLQL